jgi:hypothetical protein
MDNAMFAVNYFTAIAGGGIAYVDHKLTVQLEATLLQLFRVRGDNAAAATDSTRTNSTVGLHAGYFIIPMLSLGGELRYQRWLSTPTQISMMNKVDIPGFAKDTVTFAIGPRAHFQVGKGMFLRPGIAYARGLDKPLTDATNNMVQVYVPFYYYCGPQSGFRTSRHGLRRAKPVYAPRDRGTQEGSRGLPDRRPQGSPTKPSAAVPISPR